MSIDNKIKFKMIRVKNFKGIKDIVIENAHDVNFIFGKNGTNKSTLLEAIRLMIDDGYKNKYEFTEEDFNINTNTEENIEIIMKVYYPSSSSDRSPFIDFIDDMYFKLVIEKSGENSMVPQKFESYDGDNWIKTMSREWNWLKGITVIYVKPNYSLTESKNVFIDNFRNKNRIKLSEEINTFQVRAKKNIKNLLSSDPVIFENINAIKEKLDNKTIEIENEISTNLEFVDLKYNIKNQTSFSHELRDKEIKNIGNGLERIESLNIDINSCLIKNENQILIFLLEEIENNLHISLQRKIINDLYGIKNSQNIIFSTTHSSNIIRYGEGYNFIRFSSKDDVRQSMFNFLGNRKISPFYEGGIAESLFYENVLLVEGDTEMIFYDFLYQNNKIIKEIIDKKDIYIHVISGAYGYKFNAFFNDLGINSYAKIDNDLDKEGEPYRIRNILNHSNKLNNNDLETKINKSDFQTNWDDIEKELLDSKVIMTKSNNSFEGELIELFGPLLSNEDAEKLKNQKVKFLEKLLYKKNIKEFVENLTDFTSNENNQIFKFLNLFR